MKETEDILGYSVSNLTCLQAVDRVIHWLTTEEQPKMFVCVNPHSLVEADKDAAFARAIKKADLVTPDGSGIVLASRLLGGQIQERVTGSDMFYALSKKLDDTKQGSFFFLGSTEKTLSLIKEKLSNDYPNIAIAGIYSPPYKNVFDDEDTGKMIEAINSAKPDVLWVGMTAPKQEKWIYENIDKLDVKFAGAIGAVFDFYVGNVKRSHPIFQNMGLEWLPRLLQEPRRLFRRNFVSSPLFLLKVFKQKLRMN